MPIPVGPVYAAIGAAVIGYWVGLYMFLSCSPHDLVALPGDDGE